MRSPTSSARPASPTLQRLSFGGKPATTVSAGQMGPSVTRPARLVRGSGCAGSSPPPTNASKGVHIEQLGLGRVHPPLRPALDAVLPRPALLRARGRLRQGAVRAGRLRAHGGAALGSQGPVHPLARRPARGSGAVWGIPDGGGRDPLHVEHQERAAGGRAPHLRPAQDSDALWRTASALVWWDAGQP